MAEEPIKGEGATGAGDKGSGGTGDTISKEEMEKVKGDLEKSNKELDDMRLEVMSDDYLDFLKSKESGGDKGKGDKGKELPPASDTTLSDEKLESMSKKELLAEAERRADVRYKKSLEDMDKKHVDRQDSQARSEIEAFARGHEDFSTYRPIMYGLSRDPKNKTLTLGELYAKSIELVKRIHTEPTEEEKEKSKKSSSEKPGGDSESYDRLSKLSPDEAAREALEETKAKFGPIPSG